MAKSVDRLSKIERAAKAALKNVIDPELGVDLVNLGLIYEIKVVDTHCIVTMTLTTMGCPLGNLLADQIKAAVTAVKGISTCKIHLVWDPIWNINRMSRVAKVALGIHE
ncbi:metal-sulfur cluster assembly factor [Lentilactobacillus raoultii]|uniref:Metal-sulfur cluster assembly factor n=1 Tax=Lentilactobacillus raoultii TaxID=1987503 RepID=A0ABW3PMZ6_9LACO|nr:metal-sulfur cluster assembly factor [Lentilactobacillus raoultii]